MTSDRRIEIYVKASNIREVVHLFEKMIGELKIDTALGGDDVAYYENEATRLSMTTNIEGTGFSAIEILGPDLPWSSSRECARVVAAEGSMLVRFEVSDPKDPEIPLAVEVDSVGGERLVMWELL